MITLPQPLEFEWDRGNQDKNWEKHSVTATEAEEAFLSKNKKIWKDKLHWKREQRYILLGETKGQRKLFIVFTLRKKKIRIISARTLNKKEYYLLKG